MELERQESVLVVCHQAVMRCILAYFLNKTGGIKKIILKNFLKIFIFLIF
jgi:broad specificity phosphatase PhoE